jgi:alkylation response protein AidB-like acyl-CoA dehydrogenase
VELDLTEDQTLFRDTSRRFIEEQCPLSVIRTLITSERGMSDEYFAVAGQLGWFSLLVAEEHGGGSISQNPIRDAAIVAELRGTTLQPGPFVAMNVVASALSRTGSAAQRRDVLAPLLAGETIGTWVATDALGSWAPGASIVATPRDGGWTLSGVAELVHDAVVAEWLLVTACMDGSLTQFLIETASAGVFVEPRECLDVTQRYASVTFHDVEVGPEHTVGPAKAAQGEVEHQFQISLVLTVAEMVGALDALFELTREYALARMTFGKPIGSNQAIKHQLADMSLSLESAKAVLAAAISSIGGEIDEPAVIVSMAKAWLGDVAIDVAQGCLQIFAGIGFTWEHDAHLFVRRVTTDSLILGSAEWHRERIFLMSNST